MARFLVDEDMPRSTASVLRDAGHVADDVRDVGLRGRTDDEIFAQAQLDGAAIVTADKDFADIVRFRPGTHSGIVVLRVPNSLPTDKMNETLLSGLAGLGDEDMNGLLVIVEPGRVRMRRTPKP